MHPNKYGERGRLMSSINVVDCILEVKIWCMFGFIWTWTYIGIRIDMAISLKNMKDYFDF